MLGCLLLVAARPNSFSSQPLQLLPKLHHITFSHFDDGHFEKTVFRYDGIITTRESSENADRMVAIQIGLLAHGSMHITGSNAIERGVRFIETGHVDFPELACSL